MNDETTKTRKTRTPSQPRVFRVDSDNGTVYVKAISKGAALSAVIGDQFSVTVVGAKDMSSFMEAIQAGAKVINGVVEVDEIDEVDETEEG